MRRPTDAELQEAREWARQYRRVISRHRRGVPVVKSPPLEPDEEAHVAGVLALAHWAADERAGCDVTVAHINHEAAVLAGTLGADWPEWEPEPDTGEIGGRPRVYTPLYYFDTPGG